METNLYPILFKKLTDFQKAVAVHLPIVGLSHFKIEKNDDKEPLILIDVRSFGIDVEEIHVGILSGLPYGNEQYFYIAAFSQFGSSQLYKKDQYPWGKSKMDYIMFVDLLNKLNDILTESLHEEI